MSIETEDLPSSTQSESQYQSQVSSVEHQEVERITLSIKDAEELCNVIAITITGHKEVIPVAGSDIPNSVLALFGIILQRV
eukprot:IDg8619t1